MNNQFFIDMANQARGEDFYCSISLYIQCHLQISDGGEQWLDGSYNEEYVYLEQDDERLYTDFGGATLIITSFADITGDNAHSAMIAMENGFTSFEDGSITYVDCEADIEEIFYIVTSFFGFDE